MTLDLANYEQKATEAVRAFWKNRANSAQKQLLIGKVDQGERAGVTSGKNMDGFIAMLIDIVRANGLADGQIYQQRSMLTLPGYFRPTKLWDLLVMSQGELVAAVELKSQVGPSFGNNFNNRAEEAIGTACDFWTGYREGSLGQQPRPFVGWLMLVEDCPKSRAAVRDRSPHFPVAEEFSAASYLQRYDLLCRKLSREGLYTSAALLASSRPATESAVFSELSAETSLQNFVVSLAGHIAIAAARLHRSSSQL
jgi:hypothetical protein